MADLSFIHKRKSCRKFKDELIPKEDILKILEAGTMAPSGKNEQNWHFVVIQDKNKLEEMAKAVELKVEELCNKSSDEKANERFKKLIKYYTLFKNAPVAIAVYSGPYDNTGIQVLLAGNPPQEEIDRLNKPNPGLQNIGAAIENMLLAATAMGYGGCWMTGPNSAANEMDQIIGFKKEGYDFTALVPMGIPAGDLMSPPRKPLEEVVTFL